MRNAIVAILTILTGVAPAGAQRLQDGPLLHAIAARARHELPSDTVLIRARAASAWPLPKRPGPACDSPAADRGPGSNCLPAALNAFPRELVAAAAASDDSTLPSWTADDLPPGTELLPDSALSFAANRQDIEGFWRTFHERYPGRRGFLQVSHPIVGADGRAAIAHVAIRCGGLCGHGISVLLERNAAEEWTVTEWFTLWRS